MGTDFGAGTAGHALLAVHTGTAGAVHIPLALVGAAAHAQILQRTAEARLLVTLEVVQGDDDVGIHDGTADHGVFHILAALDGDGHLVGALQAVTDDHMAAGGIGGEAVEVSGLDVIQGILPGADIHGVAVRQEGLAAQLLHKIHHHPGIAGAQMGHVAQLTKVNLDGNVLVLEIDLIHSGGHNQPGQLLGQRLGSAGAEIGEINLGCHGGILLIKWNVHIGFAQHPGKL